MSKARDNAIAPSAGYIFQFEIALVMLADLEKNKSKIGRASCRERV